MNKRWSLAISISLLIHVLVLTGFPPLTNINKSKKIFAKAEEKKEIRIEPKKIEKIQKIPQELIKDHQQQEPLPYVEKIMSKLIQQRKLSTRQKPHLFEKSLKEVLLSEVPKNQVLKDNPSYMDYYRLIREKIRANTAHNYHLNTQGEITASFMVLQNGTIDKIELNPKNNDNRGLRKIALKSIQNAAPLPSFPKEFKSYSYLPFNITIYFKDN